MENVGSLLLLVCLMSYSFYVEGKTNCDTLGVNFYDYIGCIRQNTGEDCPSYNDCKYERPPGKCLYNGDAIENRRGLGTKDHLCNFGCVCSAPNNTKGEFICAAGRCGSWGFPIKQNCYLEYELDTCCGFERCEPSKASCNVDGTTYREGEKFYPNDECSVCICTSEFNGKYEGPHCKRRPCDAEIHHAEKIERNCAPVFYKRDGSEVLCCPHTFVCPSDEDNIKEPNNHNSEQTCRYGTKTYNLGTTFARNVEQYGKKRTVLCECKLPPLFTCTADY